MNPLLLLFFCFVGINSAAIGDKNAPAQKRSLNTDGLNYNQNGNNYIPNGNNYNQNGNNYNANGYNYNQNSNANGNSWQLVQTYHPPGAQAIVGLETNAYPKYDFEYAVSDRRTGDHKHHFESRDGNRVRGEYGLVEADGSLRKVQYNADDFNGFNAVVSKTVNRHGDSAISVSGQSRQFAPSFNQEVRINQFFPSKDTQVPVSTRFTNVAAAAAHPNEEGSLDAIVPQVPQQDNTNIIPEGREQFVVQEFLPSETTNPENLPTQNYDSAINTHSVSDSIDGTYISPSALPVIAETLTNSDADVHIAANTDNTATYAQQENAHPNGEEVARKDDSHPKSDSDVSSSYYHSKVYYVNARN